MRQYAFLITTLAVLAVAVIFVTLHGVRLSNEQYDRLKNIVIKWSGITTFLGVIVATFSFPYGEETITLVAAIGAFMAYMLNISDKSYNDGAAIYDDDKALEDGDLDE